MSEMMKLIFVIILALFTVVVVVALVVVLGEVVFCYLFKWSGHANLAELIFIFVLQLKRQPNNNLQNEGINNILKIAFLIIYLCRL